MNIRKILGIPKSIFFNLYYFPFKTAIRLPVIVAPDVKLANMGSRKSVQIDDPSKRVSIGFGESFALGGRTYWNITNEAHIVFHGSAQFGRGTQIISGGVLNLEPAFIATLIAL